MSGGRDRHTASGRSANGNTVHGRQTKDETQIENTWTAPVGAPAPRAPAIRSNETSDAPGVANGRPAPRGSRSAAARIVGTTGDAGAPPPRSPSPAPRMNSPARRRGPLARSPRVQRLTSAHPGGTAPAEWRDQIDPSAAPEGVLLCASIPQAKAPSWTRRTRDLQPQHPSLDMWLRAWSVDLDRLVERLASQGPIAFFGAAKTWRGRRYRIERFAALKVETRADPSLVHERFAALKVGTRADPSLMRETLDRGDRILPEASAAHRSSGELPADSSGFVAIAPRLEHFLADCYIVELDVTGQDFRYLQQEFVLADIKSPITKARRGRRPSSPPRARMPVPGSVPPLLLHANNRACTWRGRRYAYSRDWRGPWSAAAPHARFRDSPMTQRAADRQNGKLGALRLLSG